MGVTKGGEPGTHYATGWILLLWLPLIPLRREKVVFGEVAHGPFGGSSVQEFTILRRLPLSLGNIVRTYVLTYLVFFPLLLGPVVLVFPIGAEVIRWEWLKQVAQKKWFAVWSSPTRFSTSHSMLSGRVVISPLPSAAGGGASGRWRGSRRWC